MIDWSNFKKCKKCGDLKERSLFPKAHENADGLLGHCRDCEKSRKRPNNTKELLERRAKGREYMAKHKQSVREIHRLAAKKVIERDSSLWYTPKLQGDDLLYTAAPDLYNALQELLAAHSSLNCLHDGMVMNMARAALRKADTGAES